MTHENSYNGLEIAIIGMSLRFPGAHSIHEFWENLKNGVESITFFTNEELIRAGVDPGLINNPNYVKTCDEGVEDGEYFDANFFGYTAHEAEVMTPQTRIFHECCWEALEDAGYDPWSYSGVIGLYAGGRNSFDWQALAMLSGKSSMIGEVLASTLYDKDNMTFRVSYNFNLRGPSFSLNTACSTGLVAVHLACQALLSGECEMALAGGAAVTVWKKTGYLYQDGDIFSPDGHIRAFDARAKGLVYCDGLGVVLLKPLEDAAVAREHIYAVIKGSAINNDGHNKVSYTAPAVKGQEAVIRAAQMMADVEPESIGCVETHGTGTTVGDPIEIQALKQAFNSTKKHFCAIGSVKTNVGHMSEAAGAGGLIKMALALYHRWLPASLHFETPNPDIDFENSPFYVNTTGKEWKNDFYPLRAGVSSFARGGTNAHLILEEPPKPGNSPGSRPYQLILLSAKTGHALDRMTENLANYFKKNPANPGNLTNSGPNLPDAAHTLQVGRKVLPYRRKFVCSDAVEAVELLSSPGSRNVRTFFSNQEERQVVFIFPGLGAQYENMGLELYRTESSFRRDMDHCFEILKSLEGDDIKEILYPYPGGNRLIHPASGINRIDIAQPVVFIFEYALAKLLMKWEITPDAMIGYSFGEYTAACISGVFSLEDALKLIIARGRLIDRVPTGRLLSVPLPVEEVQPLLNHELSIAIDNGPSCIAAGPDRALDSFRAQLKGKSYICMELPNSHALHSSMMEPILEEFGTYVRRVTLKEPRIPYISNVTGNWITVEEALDPSYWTRHLGETVQFARGIEELVRQKNVIFVEIGPGRDLSALVARNIDKHPEHQVVNLVRPAGKEIPDVYYLLNKIGDLWLYGKNIDWSGFYSDEARYRIPLPTYPYQRQRYSIEIPAGSLLEQFDMNLGTSTDSSVPGQPVEGHGKDRSSPNLMNPYTAPESEMEKIITGVWQELLGVKEIGIEDDFLEWGGDSLKAITLLSRLRKIYNTEIPLTEFFKSPTIKRLKDYIRHAEKSAFQFIPAAEAKSYYALSPVQKRLFILQQMDPGNTSYNLPQGYNIMGEIDRRKMENTFKRLIRRHECLRTSFRMMEGEPVQRIHEAGDVEFGMEFYLAENDKINHFIQPFDLSRLPLIRGRLLKLEDKKHILEVDMHHIVSDGVSNALFIQDFIFLYAGFQLPPLKIQYKDYCDWQNSPGVQESLNRQEAFWLKELDGKLPLLNLPTNFSRDAGMSYEGNRVHFEIPEETTVKLKELAKHEDATLYMILLSMFNVMLSKICAQTDIVIGVDTAGRTHADFEKIIGVFINTLVLRTFPAKEKTFRAFLDEVKTKTLQIFENQDYPFDRLVDKLVKKRNPSRNPIFDVMFSYEHFEINPLEIPENIGYLELKPYNDGTAVSKLDINIKARPGPAVEIIIEYKTKLFNESTVQRFAGYFKEIAGAVIRNPDARLKDIKITHDLLKLGQDTVKPDLEF